MLPYKMLLFMGLFLLLTVSMYSFLPKSKRYVALLSLSLIFYTVYSKAGVLFLLTTIVTTYIFANMISNVSKKYDMTGLEKEEKKRIKSIIKSRKKHIITFYISINLGILILIKYFNFFADGAFSVINSIGYEMNAPIINILLPLGISYYTLQSLGYVIDVYRGKYLPEKNILKLGLFIGFFPQLYEGPFGRYDELMPQMSSGEDIKLDNVYSGILEILYGLFKLFMISNRAAIIADFIFKNYSEYSGFGIVIGAIAFTIQLYTEFSGYIGIASGISKIFGIILPKNFNMPFLSQNVGEFWRRWHMSLGAWFRDYVFYTASTSKIFVKIGKKLKNNSLQNFITVTCSMFAVWFFTGLWHGANVKYIVYGLYYFILMIIYNLLNPYTEKLLNKLNISVENKALVALRIVKTLILVGIGMMIFRSSNMTEFYKMFLSIFSLGGQSLDIISIIEAKDLVALIISLIILICISLLKLKNIDLFVRFNKLTAYRKYWLCFTIFCIIMIFGAYGLGYLPPDPIYGGF